MFPVENGLNYTLPPMRMLTLYCFSSRTLSKFGFQKLREDDVVEYCYRHKDEENVLTIQILLVFPK